MSLELKSIEDAWLGIDFQDKELFNPTSIIKADDSEYHLKLIYLMTRPEYSLFYVSTS